MDKDEKKITGSQESIQARLAALNALMHKTPVPAPSEEVPKEQPEATAAGEEKKVSTEAVSPESNASDAGADTEAGNNSEKDVTQTAETASEEQIVSDNTEKERAAAEETAETSEEASAEEPTEAKAAEPENTSDPEISSESENTAGAEESSVENTSEAMTGTASETEANEAVAEGTSDEATVEDRPAEAGSEGTEEAPKSAEEETPAEEVSETETPAEASAEAAEETQENVKENTEEPAETAEGEPKAEAKASQSAPVRSAFMDAAALKERMAALMAGIQIGNGAGNTAAAPEPEPEPASRKDLKNLSVPALLKNGFDALEQSDFEGAAETFEAAAQKDEKCASAYFGKLLSSFNVKDTSEFLDLVLIRTRKNLPKKKVTPVINQDFDAFIRKECLCSSDLDPKEVKILFNHLKTPYRSVVNGIDSTLSEGKDLVEVYCDYMGSPASDLYRSFRSNATEEELSSYDINPSLRERLTQIKEEEIEHDRRRNTGEELQDLFRQVDEIYDATAGSSLSPALRVARALQKAGRIGCIPFGHKLGSDAPLGWVPVYSDGERILLMTKDCVSFSVFGQTNKWKDSEIRSWLNDTFFKDSFSDQEKALIRKETQENPANTKFNAEGGIPTSDPVFLFSIPEAIRYFSEEGDRASDDWYWLRSPGGGGNYVACVEPSGRIDEYGSLMTLDSGGVRPAIWISFVRNAE